MPRTDPDRDYLHTWAVVSLIVLLSAVLTFGAAADTIHDNETIDVPVTWEADGNDHVVVGVVTVNSDLTIEDGCVVRFDHGANVGVYGSVIATGDPEEILFTREDPSDEWWGIRFYPGSTGTLTHCTFEHATYEAGFAIYASSATVDFQDCEFRENDTGIDMVAMAAVSIQDSWFHDNSGTAIEAVGRMPELAGTTIERNAIGLHARSVPEASLSSPNLFQDNDIGVRFESCTNPAISNQTITGSNGVYGALFMDTTGQFHIGTGNTITGNSWGLSMSIGSYPDAASAPNLPVAGNTNDDGMQVRGGDTAGDIVWHDVGERFVLTGTSATVSAGDTFSIEDGVQAAFDDGMYLRIWGTIVATGTASPGVLFTRRDIMDEWWGLWFFGMSVGSFDHCTFEHATYDESRAINGAFARSIDVQNCECRFNDTGIYLANVASSSVDASWLHDNGDVAIRSEGVMPEVGSCTIENNTTGLHVESASPATLSSPNVFQNNVTGVIFRSCTGPDVSNQTITGSNGDYGALFMDTTGQFHIGTGNTITGNSWGLSMSIGSYPDLASAPNLPIAGNTNDDGMQVRGGSTAGDIFWHDLDEDFVVSGVSPAMNHALLIEDGVRAAFDHGMSLNVGGTVVAVGSASPGVLFTRRDPEDEWWGIWFSAASSATFERCTFEHATYGSAYGIHAASAEFIDIEGCEFRDNDTGVYTSHVSSVGIQNSWFHDNAAGAIRAHAGMPLVRGCMIERNKTGLHIQNATGATLVDANVFQDNDTGIRFESCVNPDVSNQTITGSNGDYGALFMDTTGEFHIGAGNTITGNTWGLSMSIGSYPDLASAPNLPVAGNTNDDGMQVRGGYTAGDIVWHDLGEDFVVSGVSPTILAGHTLSIEDGVQARFDHGLSIQVEGALTATGMPSSGILFSRRDPTDDWRGIWFGSGSTGSFKRCTIEYATYTGAFGVHAVDADAISFDGCLIQANDTGVYAGGCSPSFLNTVVTGNSEYGVHLDGACAPSFGSGLAEWNDIYGNGSGNPGRDLRNGTLDITAEYVNWGVVLEAQIEERIHHEPDDGSLGLVDYSPWTDAEHELAYDEDPLAVTPPSTPMPIALALSRNRPNPVRSGVTFRYALPEDAFVSLEVFGADGRRVAVIESGFRSAGFKETKWDATSLASGTYVYRLRAGTDVRKRKLVVVR